MPAISEIIESENKFNELLPKQRLTYGAPPELLAAAQRWSDLVWAEAANMPPATLLFDDINKGLALARRPVFICGVHRSGTTLVRDLLDDHPELVVLPSEGTYYTNLEAKLLAIPERERMAFMGKEWLRRLANPINQSPYWLLGRTTEIASPYVDFARYLMAWWKLPEVNPQVAVVLAYASVANKLGAKFWVDKTPTNERFLKRIWQEMPEAKIIHVVREPLATLASRKQMEPTITLKRALRDLEASYSVAVEQMALQDERFLLVRYEELCEYPERFKEQVALFLGIESLDILNRATVAGMASKANSSFGGAAIEGQVLKADQHIQTDVLNIAERRFIAANIGELAGKLGYKLPFVKKLISVYLRLKYRIPA